MNGSDRDLHMRDQPRWFAWGLLPLAIGLVWLGLGLGSNVVVAIVACLPGVVLVSTGCALLLWPGDPLIGHYMALACVVSAVLALPVSPIFGVLATACLLLGSVASFLVAGRAALWQNASPRAVPPSAMTLNLVRKAATDAALLGFFLSFARIPRGESVARDARELDTLERLARADNWADEPQRLHRPPDAPSRARLQGTQAFGQRFEWLSFDSGYTPDAQLPGAERWAGHAANRRMHARVLRHPGAPRPWLMCVHGYRMGLNGLDLSLFDIRRLHHRLGLNLIMPILPLHGARSASRITGGLFLDGPLADLLHAESQALWDLRRCLAWVRQAQPDQPAGVLGYSLGGYNAALLAGFEPDLACVIAGIPLTDIPAALWRHMPAVHLRYIEARGIAQQRVSDLLAPVSPLHIAPRVARQRRYIFAATGDQLVPPEQPLRLWRHWEEPEMHWYHGSHLSVRQEKGLPGFVEDALAGSGLITRRNP